MRYGSRFLVGFVIAALALGGVNSAAAQTQSAVSARSKIDGCVIKPRAVCPRTDFGDANLKRVDLRGANLRGSNFRLANVEGANLTGADLRDIGAGGAWGADPLTGNTVVLPGSWAKVRASGANLSGAEFYDGNLAGAQLLRANMTGFFSTRTRMANANMSGATLVRAEIYGTPEDRRHIKAMGRFPFRGLNLTGANLSDALLSIDLRGVNLSRANLTRANLRFSVNLQGATTAGAVFCGATLPEGYQGPIDTDC